MKHNNINPYTSNKATCHQYKSIAGDLNDLGPFRRIYSTQKFIVSVAVKGRSRKILDSRLADSLNLFITLNLISS